jgi:hypothetical protein
MTSRRFRAVSLDTLSDLDLLRSVLDAEGASRSKSRYLPRKTALRLIQEGLLVVADDVAVFPKETAVRLTEAGRARAINGK